MKVFALAMFFLGFLIATGGTLTANLMAMEFGPHKRIQQLMWWAGLFGFMVMLCGVAITALI